VVEREVSSATSAVSVSASSTLDIPTCRALQRWLDQGQWRTIPYPPAPGIPRKRGDLTIADVRRAMAESPEAYEWLVERWERTTWDAFESLHELTRRWVDHALDSRGSRG
jgi:hypothetical protein